MSLRIHIECIDHYQFTQMDTLPLKSTHVLSQHGRVKTVTLRCCLPGVSLGLGGKCTVNQVKYIPPNADAKEGVRTFIKYFGNCPALRNRRDRITYPQSHSDRSKSQKSTHHVPPQALSDSVTESPEVIHHFLHASLRGVDTHSSVAVSPAGRKSPGAWHQGNRVKGKQAKGSAPGPPPKASLWWGSRGQSPLALLPSPNCPGLEERGVTTANHRD